MNRDEKEVGSADEKEADPADERPSRTELTRAAARVNELGLALTRLSPSDLDRLNLPPRVREEVALSQRLKPRSRGRQNRLIGQLLRAEDHEAIRHDLDRLKGRQRDTVQREKQNEAWLERIVEQGDVAIESLLAAHPNGDRQRLRSLGRTARHDPQAKKTKRARRELLRAIRELRTETPPTEESVS